MNKFAFPLLLASVLAVAGCGIPMQVPPAEKLSDAAHGSVIIVGRVELDPPLDAKDQILTAMGSERMRNKVYINLTSKLVRKDDALLIGPDYIEDKLGDFFFVKRVSQPTYIQDLMIYTAFGTGSWDSVKLPGGLKVDIRAGDRAIYIGTLRYTRNEYFDIIRAQRIDEYARANAAFRKKFGARFNLRDAMVTPVDLPR